MTLTHYDGTALVMLDREKRRINLARLWGRGRGSRFCPACLGDNGGRWLLRWRLGWSFACTHHRCLLADSCPACGRIPRRDTLWLDVPQANRCSEHPGPTAGRALVRCHADLTTAPVLSLPHGHPVLRAQELINDCINENAAGFGVYAPIPVSASTMLRDLQLLSRAVLRRARERDLVEFAPADLCTEFRAALEQPDGYLQPQSLGNDPGRTCPPRAVFTALAATVGITILTQPDMTAAAVMLTAFNPSGSSPDLAMRQQQQQAEAGIDADQGIVTTRNQRAVRRDHARTQRRAPDILGGPSTTTHVDRASQLPTLFWPWWSIRLIPNWADHRRFRSVLSCLVLASGTSLSITEAAVRFGPTVTEGYLRRGRRLLRRDPLWPDIHQALNRLARYLDTHATPIDYQRRRDLNYHHLLPTPEWADRCARAGILPGHHGLKRTVRAALYETLSGHPYELGPPQFAPTTHAQRTAVANLPCRITPQLNDVLRDAAHDYLAKHGIDEPVNWQPPTDLAADLTLTLPGPDPNQLDLTAAHHMVLHGHTLSRIAASLGTTNDTVRYLLSQTPPARDDPTKRGSHRQTLSDLRQQLPKAQFHRHYVQDGRSLSALADHYGIHRRYLMRLAHAYNIPLRDPHAPPTGITKAWLTEHYHGRNRSASDIALELGLHCNTVLHWCRHYNIPIKPQGPAGHRAARQTRR